MCGWHRHSARVLSATAKYAIYLPPGYDSSDRSYPVLYLLHPAGPKGTLPNQLACGDGDALSVNNVLLHADLKKMNVPHEFRIQDGKHDWGVLALRAARCAAFCLCGISEIVSGSILGLSGPV